MNSARDWSRYLDQLRPSRRDPRADRSGASRPSAVAHGLLDELHRHRSSFTVLVTAAALLVAASAVVRLTSDEQPIRSDSVPPAGMTQRSNGPSEGGEPRPIDGHSATSLVGGPSTAAPGTSSWDRTTTTVPITAATTAAGPRATTAPAATTTTTTATTADPSTVTSDPAAGSTTTMLDTTTTIGESTTSAASTSSTTTAPTSSSTPEPTTDTTGATTTSTVAP